MKRKAEHNDVSGVPKKQAALLRRTVNPLKLYTCEDKRFFLNAKEHLTLAKFSSLDLVHPVGNNWLSCRTSKIKESLPSTYSFSFQIGQETEGMFYRNSTTLYCICLIIDPNCVKD